MDYPPQRQPPVIDEEAAVERQRKRRIVTKNQTAMRQLAEIVGTSRQKQDIYRINAAQSANGAQRWINSNKNYEGYKVITQDIDEDGIKDVLVKDVNGNLVLINGYTVKKSDYPYRQKYYELAPEERKNYKGYRDYMINGVYKPIYNQTGRELTDYTINPEQDEYSKAIKKGEFRTILPRKTRSTYQVFSQVIVKQLLDYMIKGYRLFTNQGKKPNIYMKLVSEAWKEFVVRPTLEKMNFNTGVINNLLHNKDELNKLKKEDKDFKKYFDETSAQIVDDYMTNNDETTQQNLIAPIFAMIEVLANNWLEETGNEPNEHYGELDNTVPLILNGMEFSI